MRKVLTVFLPEERGKMIFEEKKNGVREILSGDVSNGNNYVIIELNDGQRKIFSFMPYMIEWKL